MADEKGPVPPTKEMGKFDALENMRAIRILSERPDVIPLKSIAAFVRDEVVYTCEKGSAQGLALMKDDHVAVQFAYMSADTVMDRHTHIGNTEFLIVIAGELFSKIGDEVKSAKAGEIIVIPAGQTHIPYCEVPTTLIGITVPASEGYPSER